MQYEFFVYHLPEPEPRKQHRLVRTPGREYIQTYTKENSPVNVYKQAIKFEAMQAIAGRGPLSGPLSVEIQFIMPRPKSIVWKRKEMIREWHWGRPDIDNLQKALFDALNGVAWNDDGQVCELDVIKIIAAGDEPVGVYFRCKEIAKSPDFHDG